MGVKQHAEIWRYDWGKAESTTRLQGSSLDRVNFHSVLDLGPLFDCEKRRWSFRLLGISGVQGVLLEQCHLEATGTGWTARDVADRFAARVRRVAAVAIVPVPLALGRSESNPVN